MTVDLTKITTPFGLLDAETQEALKAHGGPYECYYGEWEGLDWPAWDWRTTYRVKPQPPKPRECWVVYHGASGDPWGGAYPTEDEAIAVASKHNKAAIIHMREVLK